MCLCCQVMINSIPHFINVFLCIPFFYRILRFPTKISGSPILCSAKCGQYRDRYVHANLRVLSADNKKNSFFVAIAILLPTGCGVIVGCLLYRNFDLKPKHSNLITITTSVLFFVGFLVLIAFRCDTRQMAGSRTNTGYGNHVL